MASLSLKNICKVYPNGFEAVKDFNLEVEDQEFIIFVGPSGCGKSTTLRMIAGLEEISSGEFYIDGKLMNDVEPKDRDIAMVFQNYALYPHMTVFDNMAFGLKLRKVPKDEIKRKVEEAAKILDLEKLLDRKPKALSGGQRQRVAMGRAIVRNPKVFLMDEPLSNLDAKLRVQMRSEIASLHNRLKATIIYVTHDQTEAMTLGTRIVVLKDGDMVEIRSLKRILEECEKPEPVLCIVDEVLRGTNTIERIAASSQILHSLAKPKVLAMAATHDIELSYVLEKEYDNYHFEEEIQENDVVFDYKLRTGRAMTRNAIRLLAMIGYDPKIIEAAQESAKHFEETGVWK